MLLRSLIFTNYLVCRDILLPFLHQLQHVLWSLHARCCEVSICFIIGLARRCCCVRRMVARSGVSTELTAAISYSSHPLVHMCPRGLSKTPCSASYMFSLFRCGAQSLPRLLCAFARFHDTCPGLGHQSVQVGLLSCCRCQCLCRIPLALLGTLSIGPQQCHLVLELLPHAALTAELPLESLGDLLSGLRTCPVLALPLLHALGALLRLPQPSPRLIH
mmetsp:Transcript_48404/g.85252  ORF Transcript_48404/g.85252 Transcript_48404/m.85252 type:complete len:218 (+) Transcript_48404:418-1071(+)